MWNRSVRSLFVVVAVTIIGLNASPCAAQGAAQAAYDAAVSAACRTWYSYHAVNYSFVAKVRPSASDNATLVTAYVAGGTVTSIDFGLATPTANLRIAVVSIEAMFAFITQSIAVAGVPSSTVDPALYSLRFERNYGYPLHYIAQALQLYPQIDIASVTIIAVNAQRTSLRSQLTANQAIFSVQNWRQYSYRQQETCALCSARDPSNPGRTAPVIVNVISNVVQSVTDAAAGNAVPATSYLTISGWFEVIQFAVDSSPLSSLVITFDSSTGCPSTFRYVDVNSPSTPSDIPTFYFSQCSPTLHPPETSYVWAFILGAIVVAAVIACVSAFFCWKFLCRAKEPAPKVEPRGFAAATMELGQSGGTVAGDGGTAYPTELMSTTATADSGLDEREGGALGGDPKLIYKV